nr:reverse transcriptase domain-containing protein [Tanacetum cinerariifolium]
ERSGDQVGSGRGSQGGSRGGQGSGRGSQEDGRDGQKYDQGSQGSSRGNRANKGCGGVPDFSTLIAQQLQDLLPIITRGQEAAAGMTWKGFKTLTREVLYPNNEMQKLKTEFLCHAMVGAGHAAYTDRFYKLARLFPHLVTPENKRIERLLKRGNNKEPSKDGNARNDNKRSTTGMAFSTTTNPVWKEYTGTAPECPNCNYHHQHE